MNLGIIGGGIVGKAVAHCFKESHNVRIFDILKERGTHDSELVLDSDLVFVCLPTPQKKNSMEMDTSDLVRFFERTARRRPNTNYVLKSTVPIGFTERMANTFNLSSIVHNPEFLTTRTSLIDVITPTQIVIGGRPCESLRVLYSLYQERFSGVQILCCDSDTSETIKLLVNSFYAVKVAFFNEAKTLCDALELDWRLVLSGILGQGRISHSHTQVPGPDGKRGFGGACLPKDLAQLIHQMDGLETIPPWVMRSAYERNRFDRETPP